MSLGLLFAGQGTQLPGMLPWIDAEPRAAEALQALAEAVGAGWRQRLGDPGWATRNEVAQPLLTAVSLAAWAVLRPELPAVAAVAGYSVGELAACGAAGMLDARRTVELAHSRARWMDACVAGQATGLLSVRGLPVAQAAEAGRAHGLALAIRLGADQCVLGGPVAALGAVEQELAGRGASCRRLPVAIASHTPLLAAASAALAERLAAEPLQDPEMPLLCNATGQGLRRATEVRQALAAQVSQTVCWDQCMEAMTERGVRCVLEIGPGAALARLWNARHPEIAARSVDEFRRPESAVAWVQRVLAG